MAQGQDKPSRRVSKGADNPQADSMGPAVSGSTARSSNSLELLKSNERDLLLWLMLDVVKAGEKPALLADCSEENWSSFIQASQPQLQRSEILHGLAEASTISALLELARLRTAEQLVSTQTVADLERVLRVIERLATLEDNLNAADGSNAEGTQAELLDFREMTAEVSRLLRELDQELPELPPVDGDLYWDEPA